jgi:hypothetical protein
MVIPLLLGGSRWLASEHAGYCRFSVLASDRQCYVRSNHARQ